MSPENKKKVAIALKQLREKLLYLTTLNKLINFRHTLCSRLRVTDGYQTTCSFHAQLSLPVGSHRRKYCDVSLCY